MSSPRALRVGLLVSALLSAHCGDAAATGAVSQETAKKMSIHDLSMNRLDGKAESLGAYAGKVVLVVNTASECGYTPQYAGLEALHQELSGKGLVVLGFPSNDFGAQEPGSASDIRAFCEKNYGVTFPMFEKVVTKGADASPLYQRLGAAAGEPKWNFHKYLVNKKGEIVKGYPSSVAPDDKGLRADIDAALAQ